MQILIACAKTMTETDYPQDISVSEPIFSSEATKIAAAMAEYTPQEIGRLLKINDKLAFENWQRYRDFGNPATKRPAIFAYDGAVFKHFAARTLTPDKLKDADSKLNICSFLYGLLRPFDLINPYRLEANVIIKDYDNQPIAKTWRDILTGYLIEKTKNDDGILIDLASNEMRQLFHWERIEKELTVVSPDFKIDKGNGPKNVTMYAKICRGEMARWIIESQAKSIADLTAFEYNGFKYAESAPNQPLYLQLQ